MKFTLDIIKMAIVKKLCNLVKQNILFIILLLNTLVVPVQGKELTKVTLDLFWQHQFEFAGFYAAVDQGYFRQAGIEVSFNELSSHDDTLQRVLSGEAQFGIAGIELLEGYHNGKEVKLLASYFRRSPLMLITQPEITSLKQLSGKAVLGAKKSWHFGGIREMLKFHRVKPDSLTAKQAENHFDAFKNKEAVAMIAFISNEPYELNRLKIPYRIYDPNQYANITLDFNLFTSSQFARLNPELVIKFTEAVNLGWHYALSHREEIVDLIIQRYNSQHKTKAALQFEADETSKLIMRDLYDIGSIDHSQLAMISEQLLANDLVDKLHNIDGLLINSEPAIATDPPDSQSRLQSDSSSHSAHLALWSQLSTEEKQFLKAHPRLKVQSEKNFPPYNFVSQGKPVGYSIDYLTLLEDIIKIKFDYVSGFSWTEYLEMLQNNKLDLMVNIAATPKRKKFASFSPPIVQTLSSIIVKQAQVKQLNSLEQFSGKKVAVIKNFLMEEMLQLFYPDIKLLPVDTTLEGLTLVANDVVDGYVGNIGVNNFFITQYHLPHLVPVVIIDNPHFQTVAHRIATNRNNHLLTSIINKAVRLVPEADILPISQKWFGSSTHIEFGNVLELTDKELAYLRKHPVMTVQNESNYPPFNFTSGGKALGYSIDFIKLIASKLGIKAEFIQKKHWHEYIEMLKNKELDVMANIIDNEARREFAIFTTPYIDSRHLLVSRKGELNHISRLSALAKKRIAIVSGFAISERIQQNLPGATFIELPDTQKALEAVADGHADVMIEMGAVVNYLIEKSFLANLEVTTVPATPNETVFQATPLSMATHKDNPLLLGLLQKAIDAISETELIHLRKAWIGVSKPAMVQVPLTAQERLYLKHKNTWKVMSKDLPPVSFINNNINQGFSIDLMNIIGKLLNIKLEFSQGQGPAKLKQLMNKEVDILLNVVNTGKGPKVARFTQPYIEARDVFIIKTNQRQIEARLGSFNGKTLAVIKGDANTYHIRENYPEIMLLEVSSTHKALLAVSEGRADGHVANELVASYFIQKSFITNLQTLPVIDAELFGNASLSMAVHENSRVLGNIINKTLLAIPEEQLIALRKKWFGQLSGASKNIITTSRQQKAWLVSHDQQTLYLPELGLPLSHKTKQGYQGIVPDFVNYFKQQLAVNWHEFDEDENTGQENPALGSDITIAHSQEAAIMADFLFSEPITSMPVVAVSGNPQFIYVADLNKLDSKTTGIVQGASYRQQIEISYPELNLVPFESMSAAVLAVNRGDVDLLLCPLAHCTYIMNELGANQLRIINQTEIKDQLHFAVRADWPELVEIINNVLANMPPQLKNSIYQRWSSREDVIIKVDYSLLWYLLTVALVIIGVVVVWNRKITNYAQKIAKAHQELKNTQQQLVQSEKMASLGTLSSGVAHEINNPTSFTYASVYMMKDEIKEIKTFLTELAGGEKADPKVIQAFDEKFAKLIELTETATEGTKRIKTIVNNLRTFTRLDSAEHQTTTITELIATTVNLVRTQYDDIEITTQFNAEPLVNCYPSKLAQVFMNLTVNACQAIETQKQQTPLKGVVSITTREEQQKLLICFSDNGCGMDEKTQQRIFEPFFTTKDVGSGTGLGMSISFGIIEEHQGHFEIDSTPGQGTRITIFLPLP
ncbi:transporter substrate-binding domain-containing protein [Thalassomonas actiniarum]|uniref:histidine kinase n=1 Tax=Thalassomonas actiniarum TaxID=485447 RepID=A0AAE9YZE9_9GAMM|nr:transporter substrate-binding domain-containing protein [Thalassomonas actiniarum]WDE02348.1 transporter substrate-binding domain-containing protein [Thalassomonas actiniarum]